MKRKHVRLTKANRKRFRNAARKTKAMNVDTTIKRGGFRM